MKCYRYNVTGNIYGEKILTSRYVRLRVSVYFHLQCVSTCLCVYITKKKENKILVFTFRHDGKAQAALPRHAEMNFNLTSSCAHGFLPHSRPTSTRLCPPLKAAAVPLKPSLNFEQKTHIHMQRHTERIKEEPPFHCFPEASYFTEMASNFLWQPLPAPPMLVVPTYWSLLRFQLGGLLAPGQALFFVEIHGIGSSLDTGTPSVEMCR